MTVHRSLFRVYYEDTDAGGVVYYANYLKFAERARTEFLRERDIHQTQLAKDDGLLFVVRHVTMDLKKPARLDDMLLVETTLEEISGASVRMRQTIHCEENLLTSIEVHVVCVDTKMKPARVPAQLRKKLV